MQAGRMNRLADALSETAAAVEATLDGLLPPVAYPEGRVVEAMRYACLAGGKRLRPFLVTAGARIFGIGLDDALRVAAAVEMVHCYSLVHDDLPAMDDSDLRRGRPTAHKTFDEATAILAGDGLLTEAFSVLVDPRTHGDAGVRAALVAGLAAAAGSAGMVGGANARHFPRAQGPRHARHHPLQRLKTGSLIAFACEAGAVLGQAGAAERGALGAYGRDLGSPSDRRRSARRPGLGGGNGQARRDRTRRAIGPPSSPCWVSSARARKGGRNRRLGRGTPLSLLPGGGSPAGHGPLRDRTKILTAASDRRFNDLDRRRRRRDRAEILHS